MRLKQRLIRFLGGVDEDAFLLLLNEHESYVRKFDQLSDALTHYLKAQVAYNDNVSAILKQMGFDINKPDEPSLHETPMDNDMHIYG